MLMKEQNKKVAKTWSKSKKASSKEEEHYKTQHL